MRWGFTPLSWPGLRVNLKMYPGNHRIDLADPPTPQNIMSIGTILLTILVLLLLGAIPTWPHSRNWGYFPSGVLGFVIAVLVALFLLGKI